jgi:hypothetical protein
MATHRLGGHRVGPVGGAAGADARRAHERAGGHGSSADPRSDREAVQGTRARLRAGVAQPGPWLSICASKPRCCIWGGSSSTGRPGELLARPAHPYTVALSVGGAADRPRGAPVARGATWRGARSCEPATRVPVPPSVPVRHSVYRRMRRVAAFDDLGPGAFQDAQDES